MKKYENFCRAYKNLSDGMKTKPPYDIVTLTGLVGLFEITFEQAWKMMKEVLEEHGYNESATGSPKIIIKTAYSAGMIHDSTAWLNALSARNNVAHSYNENIAVGIIKETKEAYLDMFKELKNSVESDWLAD